MKNPASSVANLSKLFWALTILTLPVTSFRWFPFLGESTLVRPLALLPLLFLFPILLIQFWRKEIKLHIPSAFIVLGVFVLFTMVSASIGLLINPIPLRGQTYDGRVIRALVTLLIGIAFFVSAVWMNKNEDDLKFTVKWIFVGLIVTIAWSGLQALTFYTNIFDRETITRLQLAFSMRELVKSNRISGLAYEPAWLAGQLATIFIPFLFASVLTSYRLTKYKWLEPVLLILSFIVALGTFSRGGLLTIVASTGLTFLFLGRDVIASIWHWFIKPFEKKSLPQRTQRKEEIFSEVSVLLSSPLGTVARKKLIDKLLRLGILAGVLATFVGVFIFLSQREIFQNLVEFESESLSDYIVNINAGSRGAYSSAGYAVFEEYPITGVGLGASGFMMYQNLPDWSLTTLPEIARQLNPESRLYPNPKNLYIRLLAETGLLGFFLFIAFQFNILGDMLSLLKRNEIWARFAVIAGVFAWLSVSFYNFTQDSLTTPNLWLVSGIIVGLSVHFPHPQPFSHKEKGESTR